MLSTRWEQSLTPSPALAGAGSHQVIERDPPQQEINPELVDDIILLFEVEENPEKEKDLSRYEKIRLSNLRDLRPSGKVSPNLSRWESRGSC
jgi:hypothetical protein